MNHSRKKFNGLSFLVVFMIIPNHVTAQDFSDPRFQINMDTSAIAPYVLPDPLIFNDGSPVKTHVEWESKRRNEILELLESTLFGKIPEGIVKSRTEMLSWDATAYKGTALRRELRIHLSTEADSIQIDVLMYSPVNAEEPVPAFLGLNFFGNHTIELDPGVQVAQGWVEDFEPLGITGNRSNERSRGSVDDRWPVEMIISRGYGLITANYGDIDPDYHDGFKNGAHGLFPEPKGSREPNAWGSIAAWAWGLSRIMDVIETDSLIDPNRIALIGHSRLGRTAAWAGARDQRFAMVIVNNGLGGLFKRNFGETYWQTVNKFPHWFSGTAKSFEDDTSELPVDNHFTLSLIAPRPLYLGTASRDIWANPDGEFLATKAAEPVWRLYGFTDLLPEQTPPYGSVLNQGKIGFHIREGSHNITPWDWMHYLDFADVHLIE